MMFYKVGKVAFFGDWHGNTAWAETVIKNALEHMRDEDEKLLFQVGDFGFWPGRFGQAYLDNLQKLLDGTNSELFFIDGNHENHALLRKVAQNRGLLDQQCPVPVTSRITWLQRGTRARISGREWLFLGGAASVDRKFRTENQSWFPQERITDEQVESAISGGHADMLVSHDSPAFTPVTFPPVPEWPLQDLALSQVNREKLEKVVVECGIRYVVHGHLHMSFEKIVPVMINETDPPADVRVNCLNCDGQYGNWAIMDSQNMEWITGG